MCFYLSENGNLQNVTGEQFVVKHTNLKGKKDGLYTPQGAEKDYRNDIFPVTRGNEVHRIFHSKVLRTISECSLLLLLR